MGISSGFCVAKSLTNKSTSNRPSSTILEQIIMHDHKMFYSIWYFLNANFFKIILYFYMVLEGHLKGWVWTLEVEFLTSEELSLIKSSPLPYLPSCPGRGGVNSTWLFGPMNGSKTPPLESEIEIIRCFLRKERYYSMFTHDVTPCQSVTHADCGVSFTFWPAMGGREPGPLPDWLELIVFTDRLHR